MPRYCWVRVPPSGAGPRSPTNFSPIRDGVGWVKRVRSSAITVMKEIPVWCRTCSTYGCRTVVGSLLTTALRTSGASATARATDSDCVPAWSRASERAWTAARASDTTTSTTTTATWVSSTWRATDGSRARVRGEVGQAMARLCRTGHEHNDQKGDARHRSLHGGSTSTVVQEEP